MLRKLGIIIYLAKLKVWLASSIFISIKLINTVAFPALGVQIQFL